jgi:hypothetical protein
MVSERDAAMRLASLNMLEQLYSAAGGTTTWALLGQLREQQRSLIEERFKHKDRQDASKGATGTGSFVVHTVSG